MLKSNSQILMLNAKIRVLTNKIGNLLFREDTNQDKNNFAVRK